MNTAASQLLPQQLQALLNAPAGAPPAGVIPNFSDPANLNGPIIVTLVLCLVFATLAVLMRVYTKCFLIRSWDYEDYVIVLGWLLQIGEAVPSCLTIRDGGGVHMWNIQLKTFSKLLYDVNAFSIVYSVTVFFIKLSILLQYLRIFVPSRKANMAMFIAIQVVIWSNFLFYLLNVAFFIGLCKPREKIWQPWLPDGHCFSSDVWDMASGVFNAVSDITILILPMPCLWRLQIPLKKKLVTIGIFATGFFACITSILRTYYTWRVVKDPDISYNIIAMGLWTQAEIATGIIVSCLPVVPKFVRHTGPKLYRAFSHGSQSASPSGSVGTRKKSRPPFTFQLPLTNPSQTAGMSKPWHHESMPKAQTNDDYIELKEYNAMV